MRYSQLNVLGGLPALNSEGKRFSMDMHVHEEFVLAAYFNGHKSYACPDHSGLMGQGDFLSISSDIPHSAHSYNDVGCQYVAIYPTLKQIAEATGKETHHVQRRMHGVRPLQAKNSGISIGQELITLLWEDHPADTEFAVSVFLSDLFARFEDSEDTTRSASPNIHHVWEHIYETPLEQLNLGKLACSAGISKEHLCRAFKSTFGLSPFQLLRARRTSHACKLIKSGTPLSEAAIASGFSDQSHMSRWFKRIYGASPKTVALYQ